MHVIPSLFIIQSSIVLEEEGLGGFRYLQFLIINHGVVVGEETIVAFDETIEIKVHVYEEPC